MIFFGVSCISAFHLEYVENHGKPFPSGKKRSQVEFALSTEQQHSFNPNNSAIEDERVVEPHDMLQVLWKQPEMEKIGSETGSSHISALE